MHYDNESFDLFYITFFDVVYANTPIKNVCNSVTNITIT